MFTLNPRLAADTIPLGTLALSQVLLMNDARFPWLILVPARAGLREIHDLDEAGRATLIEEVAAASRTLADLYGPDKMNVGAIGNIVDQLHVHVVARRAGDDAWPGPVWGAGTPVAYAPKVLAETVAQLRGALAGLDQAK